MPLAPAARLMMLMTVALLLGGCGQSAGIIPLPGFGDNRTPGQIAIDAFNPFDPDLRRSSVTLLATSYFGGEAPYVRTYRLLIDDIDPTVRAACINALGMHGEAQDAKLIIPLLRDDAPQVRWEAAKALQKLRHPDAVRPLIEAMLSDEDADVRTAAAYALGQYREPQVFNALVAALDDRAEGVVAYALHSLRVITGENFGVDPGQWLAWGSEQGAAIFDHPRLYVWQPYLPPARFFWDQLAFWKPLPYRPGRLPEG